MRAPRQTARRLFLMKTRPKTARATRARRAGAVRPRAAVLALPAECVLAGAEGLKLRLTELLHSVKPVTLDAHAVQRIDTASMQLLTTFARERSTNNLAVEVSSASAEFARAALLLGLSALLGAAPVVEPAGSGAA
jgi:ABC-type transporter Mla MlaB component